MFPSVYPQHANGDRIGMGELKRYHLRSYSDVPGGACWLKSWCCRCYARMMPGCDTNTGINMVTQPYGATNTFSAITFA